MSVYIRKEAKDGTYSYDFQLGGRRFSGGTGTTVRREAREIEKARRQEAKTLIEAEKSLAGADMTVSAACARFWNEVGQHHRDSRTTMWSLDWLERNLQPHTLLRDIDDSKVAEIVARRRGEFLPERRKKPLPKGAAKPERRRIGPTTVNRTVTQPLRHLHIRARDLWGVRVKKIRWRDHLLSEPQERVREARPDEERSTMDELERGYDVAVRFAFLNGCRRMEIVGLIWTRVDFFNRQFRVIGKGGRERVVPMAQATFDLLWAEQGNHPEKVFTFVAKRTLKQGDRLIVRGQRYPMTDSGLKTAMRRAIARAGIEDFHFHDTRHTAATRTLRKSNLRVVQNLLGHRDIATTTKYAHAVQEDIREALEAISLISPAPAKEAGNGS
jgi:integrase